MYRIDNGKTKRIEVGNPVINSSKNRILLRGRFFSLKLCWILFYIIILRLFMNGPLTVLSPVPCTPVLRSYTTGDPPPLYPPCAENVVLKI